MAKATKTAAKAANTTESAIASALTSNYNTLIPLKDACGVYVKHPVNSKTIRVNTCTPQFLAIYQELSELGLQARIDRELAEFAQQHGPQWQRVANWLAEQTADAASDETSVED